jgi:hypothetical protein
MQGMQAWLVMILLVSLSTVSCASQRTRAAQPTGTDTPSTAVTAADVSSLAGKWRGWYIGASGSSQPLEVDVSPDGTYRSRIGTQSGIGTFKVADGKIHATGQLLGPAGPFERTAVATLSEKNGRPVMRGQGQSQTPYSFEMVKE